MAEWTDALVGKTVVGIDVSADEEALRFRCDDGSVVVWDTDGDCCSESWWADGFELNALRGGRVIGASEINLPGYDVEDGRGRQEEDEVYGVEIRTDQGVAKFAFRNSSNGYYGGWAGLGFDRAEMAWREIEGADWHA